MKIFKKNITNMEHAAKCLIQDRLTLLEDDILNSLFGGLDPRSPIAKKILKEDKGILITNIEYEEFCNYLKFELAKVIGRLENQTGVETGLVQRNTSGHVNRNSYGVPFISK